MSGAEMTNGMDTYIGRCLKNWTARFRVPADGKAALLMRAAQPSREQNPWQFRYLDEIKQRCSSKYEQPAYPHSHLLFMEPFTLSALRSFYLVTEQRLAT
jgi:hypothetical protein